MKFSLIIPTYNRASLIKKTIQSALNQRIDDFELIVVDDGSTDNTSSIVKEIVDERVTYHFIKNQERGAARNRGAELAKGEYLYFLDSDDLLFLNHLEEALSFIKKNNPIVFFQQYEITLENGSNKLLYTPKNKILNGELIEKGNFISCHGVFIKKDIFENNKFNEDRNLAGSEDYELWLRLASRYPILYNPKVTSTLVFHSSRSVINMSAENLIRRKELMLHYVFNDSVFMSQYADKTKIISSNAYCYLSLHLAMMKEKSLALKYLILTLKKSPAFLFKKRIYSILKNLSF